MQSSNEHGKKQSVPGTDPDEDLELSDAWRTLLGLRSTDEMESPSQADPTVQELHLAGDPWNHLLQTRGMESIDLQKVHLHDVCSADGDDDIAHALDLMQEVKDQSASRDQKKGS